MLGELLAQTIERYAGLPVDRRLNLGGTFICDRALRGGFRQKGVQGDPWQLGGVFVVAPGGVIRFAYASSAAGDHPPVGAILAALPGAGRAA